MKRRSVRQKVKTHRRDELLKHQNGQCCYCGCELDPDPKSRKKNSVTIEHLKPQSEGGSHEKGNLAVACYRCNTSRPKGMDWLTYKSFRMGECNRKGEYVW